LTYCENGTTATLTSAWSTMTVSTSSRPALRSAASFDPAIEPVLSRTSATSSGFPMTASLVTATGVTSMPTSFRKLFFDTAWASTLIVAGLVKVTRTLPRAAFADAVRLASMKRATVASSVASSSLP
jgi:hypothetical protein